MKKIETETAKPGTKPNTVKLPKLNFCKFSGNLLKWQECWDSFDSAIHSNEFLSQVEKMNYLRSKLEGEAAEVISGLTLTNAIRKQSDYCKNALDKMRLSSMLITLVSWIYLLLHAIHQPCARAMTQ